MTAAAPAPTPAATLDAGTELTPAERGTIEIDSVPQGAQVFFDGQPAGITPIELDDVAPGVHMIRLELAKHAPLEAQKNIRAGYSERTAQPQSARLLSKVMVQEAVAAGMEKRSQSV